MYNLNCYNWNNILPEQYIWESTCGYHALRNSICFYRILIQISEYSDYLKQIKNNQNYFSLISESDMLEKIKEYQKITDKKGDVSYLHLKKIIDKKYKNYPIQILYNLNNCDLNFKNNDIKIFILYRKKLKFSKHWLPIVIQKINNQFNLHILDSFQSTWFGDQIISNIINKLDNKYENLKINCISNSDYNFIKMGIRKMIDLILLIVILFVLIHSTYHN